MISGSLLGMVIDLLIMRPLAHKKSSSSTRTLAATIPVIASLGILAILQALAGVFWAGEERGFPTPVNNFYFKNGAGTFPFSAFNLFVIGVVLIVLLLLTYFFTQTGVGLGMRAAALNPEVARLSGIKVSRMRTLSWTISGAAGSLAGLLITPSTNLSPNTLDLILIVAFTAAVVGGLDSPLGAVIGGLMLGIGIASGLDKTLVLNDEEGLFNDTKIYFRRYHFGDFIGTLASFSQIQIVREFTY